MSGTSLKSKELERDFQRAFEVEIEHFSKFGGNTYTIRVTGVKSDSHFFKTELTHINNSEPNLIFHADSEETVHVYQVWKEQKIGVTISHGMEYARYLVGGDLIETDQEAQEFGYSIYPTHRAINERLDTCFNFLDGKVRLANIFSYGRFKLAEPFSYEQIGHSIWNPLECQSAAMKCTMSIQEGEASEYCYGTYIQFLRAVLPVEQNSDVRNLFQVFDKLERMFRPAANQWGSSKGENEILFGEAFNRFRYQIRHERDTFLGRKFAPNTNPANKQRVIQKDKWQSKAQEILQSIDKPTKPNGKTNITATARIVALKLPEKGINSPPQISAITKFITNRLKK